MTGASSGIGEEFATLLATQGVNLIIAARRIDQLNALAAKLTAKYNISVEVFPVDLTEEHASKNLFEFATREGKEVDLLINNAGAGPYRHFLKSPLVDHEKIITLNMTSLTSLCHYFGKHMLSHGRPSYILNVASVAAYQPVSRFAVYCSSKTYVRIFSQILRYELKDSNVSVSCLCPGGTKTEFLDKNNQKSKSGDRFLMGASKVARLGLEGTFKKKSVIIPGLINKLSCLFPMVLPNSLNLRISETAMAMAVEERV